METDTQDIPLRRNAGRAGDVKGKLMPFLTAILLQLALLGGSVAVVVALPTFRDEPAFKAKKTIYLPQRQLEHQAAVSEFQRAASAPVSAPKLVTESLLPNDLPALPSLPSESFSQVPAESFAANAETLLQSSGIASMLSGLSAGESNFAFLGVEDSASRIIIAFDISTSVINNMKAVGMRIERIADEALRAIEGMNANTLVNLIQFSRSYEMFANHSVPATRENKARIAAWLKNDLVRSGISGRNWNRGEPDGIQSVIEAAFSVEPDVLILISDASFQRTRTPSINGGDVPWRELSLDIRRLQDSRDESVRIHFIGFGMDEEDADEMHKIIRRWDGEFKSY